MKKRIVVAIALVAALATGGILALRSHQSSLFRSNMDALTDEESTSVSQCCVENNSAEGTPSYYLKCNSQTSVDNIYPCPSSLSFFIAAGYNSCTNQE